MNVAEIRNRLIETPFRPFAVVTSSGRKYPVPHPDFIFLTPRVVIFADTKGFTNGVDPLHVTALEDLPLGKKKAKTTRRPRR